MDPTKLEEVPLAADCVRIRNWTLDRDILKRVIKSEIVEVRGKTFYTPFRAYCSIARNRPNDFLEACPDLNCPYVNGETLNVKPESIS